MNWLLDRLAHVLVWVCGSVGPKELSGPSSPKSDHQQGAPADATLPATPHLDAHQLDKDALWRMYQERRELEKQRRFLDDLLNPPDYIEPFRHSGEPSGVVPLDAFDASARSAIAWAATCFRLGSNPDDNGELRGQD